MPSPPTSAPRLQGETLDAFVRLLSQLDEGSDERSFYDRLAEAMCHTSGMDRAIVIRYDPGQRRVRTVGGFGIDVGPFARVPLSIESAAIARDALLEDRVTEAMPPFDDVLPDVFLAEANQGPIVCVPMGVEGRLIGVVVGQRRGATELLDEAQRDALWSLGKTAALAATARIATFQQQRARSLQERIDLAREVHDRVVQRLFGVSLALSASQKDLPAEERERCAAEIGEALGDLRAALQRPLGASERETTTTLAEELARLREEAPDLQVTVDGDPAETPPALEALAQDVLLESLANARRHADVKQLQIAVGVREGAFLLEVVSDGVRSRPGPRGTGMGLRLAAFSALSHGGFVEFGPRAEGWWQVRLVVPT